MPFGYRSFSWKPINGWRWASIYKQIDWICSQTHVTWWFPGTPTQNIDTLSLYSYLIQSNWLTAAFNFPSIKKRNLLKIQRTVLAESTSNKHLQKKAVSVVLQSQTVRNIRVTSGLDIMFSRRTAYKSETWEHYCSFFLVDSDVPYLWDF